MTPERIARHYDHSVNLLRIMIGSVGHLICLSVPTVAKVTVVDEEFRKRLDRITFRSASFPTPLICVHCTNIYFGQGQELI